MSRYIDADKLKKSLSIQSASIIEIGNAVMAQIDDIPTADVRENVKGKWQDDREHNCYLCSVCGLPGLKSFGFCPNCGAEMRGEA